MCQTLSKRDDVNEAVAVLDFQAVEEHVAEAATRDFAAEVFDYDLPAEQTDAPLPVGLDRDPLAGNEAPVLGVELRITTPAAACEPISPPEATPSEVASGKFAWRNSSAVCVRFSPIPATVTTPLCVLVCSMRIPQHFLPRRSRSFGHFSFACTPVSARTASAIPTAAHAVRITGRAQLLRRAQPTDMSSELPGATLPRVAVLPALGALLVGNEDPDRRSLRTGRAAAPSVLVLSTRSKTRTRRLMLGVEVPGRLRGVSMVWLAGARRVGPALRVAHRCRVRLGCLLASGTYAKVV